MSVWFDRFTKTWASTGVVTDPSDAQANAGFAFLGAAPPTVELFNALEQYSDKKDTYLYNQMASVFAWGGQTANETNPNTLRDAIIGSQRKILTANTNYYIDVAGNDTTGNGTIGLPWKTLQFAYNYLLNKIDAAGYAVNLQLKSPGTYGPIVMTTPIRGQLSITGDKLNPRNYIVKSTTSTAIQVTQGVVVWIQGLSVEASATDVLYGPLGIGLIVDKSSAAIIDAIAFGPCSLAQIWVGSSGIVYPASGTATNNIIYGGSQNFISCFNGGTVQLQSTTITFQGVPTYSTYFIAITNSATVQFVSMTYVGSCIGPKYTVSANGVLSTGNAGATIPGTVTGVSNTGGQVI